MILWTCKETSGSLQLDIVRDLLEMKKQTFTPSLCIARARRCMKFLSFAPESEVLPPCRERDDGPWEAVHLAASWLCCCWPSGCSYSQEKRLVYCAWGGHFATREEWKIFVCGAHCEDGRCDMQIRAKHTPPTHVHLFHPPDWLVVSLVCTFILPVSVIAPAAHHYCRDGRRRHYLHSVGSQWHLRLTRWAKVHG